MPQSRSYWFVGASFLTEDGDQTDRFLSDGIWQNGYQNKYTDLVRSIQVGDKIAIKSAYVRKHNLPFNNRDQSVSVMGIKATGVVTKNHGDGRYLDVDWEPRIEPPKEWYFYTNRSTIWRITPNDWMTEGLVTSLSIVNLKRLIALEMIHIGRSDLEIFRLKSNALNGHSSMRSLRKSSLNTKITAPR